MRFRKLRIAWSVGWWTVTALLVALCLRSARYVDRVLIPSSPAPYLIESFKGRVLLTEFGPSPQAQWRYFSEWSDTFFDNAVRWSYVADGDPISNGIVIPYWPMTISGTVFVVAPWYSWRFSLRTLLIATTLVAVLLGLIVWLR